MKPPSKTNPISIHIVNDKYITNSTKSGAGKARGEGEATRPFVSGGWTDHTIVGSLL